MTERDNHNGAITVTKAAALEMWPATQRPSLRTLDRYIAQGKIAKQTFHNGRVELIRADIEKLLAPQSSPLSAAPSADDGALSHSP